MGPISWEKITTVAGIYPQRESDRKQVRPAPSPSQAIFLCTPNPFQSPEPRLGLDKVVQAPLCMHALPKLPLWTMRNRIPTFWEVKGVAHLILQSRPPCSPLAAFPPKPARKIFFPKSCLFFPSPTLKSPGVGTKATHRCQQAAPEHALPRQRHHSGFERPDHTQSLGWCLLVTPKSRPGAPPRKGAGSSGTNRASG